MDEADITQERLERDEAYRKRRMEKYELPTGKPGECDDCGEWSGRLVSGLCAGCRETRERLYGRR